MHILMYFAAVSSALIALLFVTDATLEKGAQPIVTTQRVGLPESHLPNPTQILTSKPAPAPEHGVAARAGCRTESSSGA